MSLEILQDTKNIDIIKQALYWQGFNGKIIINKSNTSKIDINQDLKKLDELGIIYKIKGD